MKEYKQLQNYAQHTSLDRIENLRITINLYKKGETVTLLDTLEAKWQQVITKDDIKAPKQLDLPSPSPSKKKSRRESKLKALKRCIYTSVDITSDLDGLAKQMNQINIAKDFMHDIKTSNGLERNLEEYNLENAPKIFPEVDTQVLGMPKSSSVSRWTETANQLSYSEMQFYASLTKRISTANPDSVTKSDPDLSLAAEEEVEQLICSINYYGNGTFVISPDFTNETNRHHFKVGDDAYEYTIENSSDKLSPENERKEQLIFEEFFKRQNRARLEKLPKEFQFIPDGYIQRVHFLGEIVSCHSFNSDILYSEYLFQVPSEWKSDTGIVNLLSASTQVSYATVVGNERISYFGCPSDLQLICGSETPKSPTLYIKVMSVDGEDRHAVEGYGTVVLPDQVGIHHFELKTWKPTSPRTNELKTFFLGGSPELGELNFNELEGKTAVNRYGLQTESSGIVKFKVQILKQKDCTDLRNMTGFEQERSVIQGSHDALEKAKMRLAVLKQLEESPSAA